LTGRHRKEKPVAASRGVSASWLWQGRQQHPQELDLRAGLCQDGQELALCGFSTGAAARHSFDSLHEVLGPIETTVLCFSHRNPQDVQLQQ
jgi:hypothetical protein